MCQEVDVTMPQDLAMDDVVFSTSRMSPQGCVQDIRFVLFIPPETYYKLESPAKRAEIGRVIGKLNNKLEAEIFLCVGPGRWGTTNPDLGVKVGYSDIYNARALVEITGGSIGSAPEASYGTHFFQDLVESNIFPLAVYLDDKTTRLNRDFFYASENQLANYLPEEADKSAQVRVVDVQQYRPGTTIELAMDNRQNLSIAYFKPAP